jgi:hypothetical protein
MRLLVCRLAAAVTLTAVLACSGLGVCWKQFARMTHHCCPGGGSDAGQIKPCASVAAHEMAVVMPPPPVATLPVSLDPAFLADAPHAIEAIISGKGPPLILRI